MSDYKITAMKQVADGVRWWAERTPEKIATMFEGRNTSYEQLDKLSSQVANGLIADGIKPQDHVGFLGKNSDWLAQIQTGASKANAIHTPVNWRLAGPEIDYIINDAEVALLFVGPDFIDVIERIKPNLKTVKKYIVLDDKPHGDWEAFPAWRDKQSDQDPFVPSGRDDVAFQLYTSGTTGRPKGVMLSNGGLFDTLGEVPIDPELLKGTWMESKDDDVSLTVSPNFHLSGNGAIFGNLRGGQTLLIHPDVDPEKMAAAIIEHRIAKIFMVPAVMQILLSEAKKGKDLSCIRVISYGAAPIPLDVLRTLIDAFPGVQFVQIYGMTEIGGGCTILPPEDHTKEGGERMRSCGLTNLNCEIKIVDPGTRQEVPRRQVGEIAIKSPGLMKGYWKRPEATAEVVQDGWYYSGDAAYMDEDGYIYVVDRLKDMIVSGGENVYCAEVENAIANHPKVQDVAVIGVPSEKWGEEVKALVVPKPGQEVDEKDIISFCRELIAGYKVPKSVEFRQDLGRNASGKLVKKDLREPYWAGQARRVG